jgi:hypothetical protein
MTHSPLPKVRQRIPYASLAGILLVVFLTLGSAAANMIPMHIPTKHELQRAEQDATAAARRERIAVHQAQGDHCVAQIARELARDLVFDGRSALGYADDYQRRCGDDPIVRRWGNFSLNASLRRHGPNPD